MADTVLEGGAKPAPTLGEKLAFSLPAIIITLLLAIGISYAILYSVNQSTLETLKKTDERLTNANANLDKEVKAGQEAHLALQKKVGDLEKVAAQLEKDKNELAESMKKVGTGLEATITKFESFAGEQKTTNLTHDKEITTTKNDVSELSRKVKYIEDRLIALKDIEKDVMGLKDDTKGLRGDYIALKGDMERVAKKADITEKDLTDLNERSRMFQLRVLAARAREAAESARHADLNELLKRLEDVEESK